MRSHSTFRAMLAIIRLRPVTGAVATVFIGQWLTFDKVEAPTLEAWLGAAMVFSWLAFAMITNDLLDIETDTVSNPSRPLVSGTLTRSGAILLSIAFGGLTLLIGVLGGFTMLMVGLVGLALGALYNIYLKRVLLLAHVVVGASVALAFSLVALVSRTFSWKLGLIEISMFLFMLGYEIIAGIPSVDGDKISGRATIASVFGRRQAQFTSAGFILLGLIVLNSAFLFLIRPLLYYLSLWALFVPNIQ